MKRTVFYSWQSDLPNKTNRGVIGTALHDAAEEIAADDTIAVEPVVDRDTQGLPGAPDIAGAIFDKIAAADLFVADVSIVTRPSNRSRRGRPAPNPNVLVELGYALRALGHDRIILVFNRAFGKVEELPFDLKMRRTLTYDMAEEVEERAPERARLTKALETALRIGLSSLPVPPPQTPRSTVDVVQEMIASPANEMRLDAFISPKVRALLEAIGPSAMPVQGVAANKEQFIARVAQYDVACRDLEETLAVLARWGDTPQVIERVFARLTEAITPQGGTTLWLNLRWYPCLRLMYAAGIAALSGRQYDNLGACLSTRVDAKSGREGRVPIVLPVVDELAHIHDAFKWLPDHERHYVPRSEHLYATLQRSLEDTLYLGSSYEDRFDEFEILLALMYAVHDGRGGGWAPPGRFGWKQRRGGDPYGQTVKDIQQQGDAWPPIKAGLFASSKDLLTIAETYQSRLAEFGWY